jgi:tetratricopeptide (TPR) repeat protein
VERALTKLAAPKQEMVDAYRGSTFLDPLDLTFWRMSAYLDLNKPDDAARQCSKAIAAGAQDGVVFRVRGAIRLQTGNHAEGIPDCDRAIELDPNDAAAYYNRGLAYEELGQTEKAKSDLQRAIELDPQLGEDAATDPSPDAK